jgi:hypothetical protein
MKTCPHSIRGAFQIVCLAVLALAPRSAGAVSAVGGDVVTNYWENGTNFTAHIFTTVGTVNLTFVTGGTVEYLVVGGGGGGGVGYGAGGGAGGCRAGSTTVTATTYPVVVGSGGSGGPGANTKGVEGGPSSFNGIEAAGGGEFYGTFNDYVGFGTLNLLPGGTGTASVWVKWNTESKAKNNYVLAKGDDNGPISWGLGLIPSDSSCDLLLLYGNAQWVGPAVIPSAPGVWHLVTAVMRPNIQQVYVDGVLAATGAKATITPAAGTGFFIGKTARADPYAYGMNGALDEARVATAQRSADWVWAEWMSVASNAVFAPCGKMRDAGTAYEQWQIGNFTAPELTDEDVSGDDADPDGDRMSNLQEFLAGTGPRDPTSFLKISGAGRVTEDGGGFVVRWSSAAGVLYRLTRSTNLADWVPDRVVDHIGATPTENVYTDAVPPNPSAFYRIEVQTAP